MANPGKRLKGSNLVPKARKKEKKFYVYYLRRPDREDPLEPGRACPFYVGKGFNNRINEHRKEAERLLHKPGKKTHKVNVIHKLWKQGLDFEEDMVFGDLTEQEAFETEQQAIEAYGRINLNSGCLTNLTNGGQGSAGMTFNHKEETKLKIGKANKGKKRTEKEKKNLSEKAKKRPRTKEHSINISKSLMGHPVSLTAREKISTTQKGKVNSPEAKEKMRKKKLGKPLSPEHKKAISEGNKKYWANKKKI